MKTRLLTTLIAVLLALTSWANGTKIDGIYYLLDEDTKTASVTCTGNEFDARRDWETVNPISTAYKGSITIPSSVSYHSTTYSVTSIGNYAFYECTGLTSITIPNSVTSIGEGAFHQCEGLTSITIPNSVTSIGGGAFALCAGLTSISIPASVTSIGEYAFSYCTGLTSVSIPNSVTSIGEGAFAYCSGLTSITIPNSVTSIGNWAFSYCYGLTSITIPNSVTSIGMGAFYDCSGLTSITIPNSVTSIGPIAFENCSGLTSITIPASVTSIGSSPFRGCTGLTSIIVEQGNSMYDSRDNCNAIIETASNELISGCQTTTIPNSVTSIGNSAFARCTGLTSITIPNSVTSIGEWAFERCTGLTSITIPASVTYIGNWAFADCTGLTDVTVQHTDPEECYCKFDAFDGSSYETATLHVPVGCVDVYNNSNTVWSRFGTITDDVAGIEPSITLNPAEEGVTYYTLQGQRIGQPQSGIVIVRYSDGTSRKMYVR